MKMIEVLNMMAEGKIKDKMMLDVYNHTGDIFAYTFDEKFKAFYDECDREMADDFNISNKFLNYDVELVEHKPKKFSVKFNMRGLKERFAYLNYDKRNGDVHMFDKFETPEMQTQFTEKELQSIRPVKEFLDDMQGKFELIEADDNE